MRMLPAVAGLLLLALVCGALLTPVGDSSTGPAYSDCARPRCGAF